MLVKSLIPTVTLFRLNVFVCLSRETPFSFHFFWFPLLRVQLYLFPVVANGIAIILSIWIRILHT